MQQKQKISWCSASLPRVVSEFGSNTDEGLHAGQVERLRKKYGENILEAEKEITFLGKLFVQFKSPLVLILTVAGVVTLFLPGEEHVFDAIVIFVAILINVVVGVFQEERASKAFEKLNESQEKRATVVRGGKQIVIPSDEVVPGDIVMIESGYQVPADMRLIEAQELQVNEAALTGEWATVTKTTEPSRSGAPIAEQYNMAWMGTLVGSGYGRGIVVATGKNTQVGIIAENLGRVEQSDTPLQKNIRSLARFLIISVAVIIVIIFILGFLRSLPFSELILMSIAVAVATMPTGLPAAVTVVLAIGMESILRKGGLVRNLLAAETLGATTVILTDKTGTLTEGRMQLTGLHALSTIEAKEGMHRVSDDDMMLLRVSVLASDAFIEEVAGSPEPEVHGRPIEKAILERGLAENLPQNELLKMNERIELLHFESSRRFGGSLNIVPKSKKKRLYVSGAPETLRDMSAYVYHHGKKVKMTDAHRKAFEDEQRRLSQQGMRMIGASYREVDWAELPHGKMDEVNKELSKDLIFVGLMAFNDPPRKDVPKAIRTVQEAGAHVIMATGDNPETALAIAKEVGIAQEDDGVILGKDLEQYDDESLTKVLASTPVFARMLPENKLRIAKLLRTKDEVVAMTGDGINDAPALRSANIGVAVGSGTEVAKEASDLILINNSFSIIVAAIEEGRKVIDNLKKIVAYMVSTNFSEIFLISAALIAGTPLPLLPAQILWANLIEGGLMSFAFAFEKPEKGIMSRDPRSSQAQNLLTGELRKLIIIISFVTGLFLIGLYFILLALGVDEKMVRTIMFVSLSLDAIFFAFSLKNLHRPVWKIDFFDNWYLVGAFVFSIFLLILSLTLPALQNLLRLEPLHFTQILLLVGVGIFNLATVETVKYFVYQRKRK